MYALKIFQQLFQWALGLMFDTPEVVGGGEIAHYYYYQPVSLLDCE